MRSRIGFITVHVHALDCTPSETDSESVNWGSNPHRGSTLPLQPIPALFQPSELIIFRRLHSIAGDVLYYSGPEYGFRERCFLV